LTKSKNFLRHHCPGFCHYPASSCA